MDKSQIKETLIRQIKEKNKDVAADQIAEMNLYELNIDSLSIMRIISYWMKEGYKVNFTQFMKAPYINSWADIIANAPRKGAKKLKAGIVSDKEPFDLTDVQYAYWIGRRESQYLGGVGCHGYMEVRCGDINISKLEEAWLAIQNSHKMLRARYTEDGKQCIMDKPYSSKINVEDVSGLTADERARYLTEKRERLSHRLLKIDEGQVAALQLTKINDKDYILHFDIDLLICDVLSFKIILRDLARFYKDSTLPDVSDWNFAQYLRDTHENNKVRRMEDEEYWNKKIKNLPDGPKIPVRHGIESIKYPRFKRRLVHYDKQGWESIKKSASDNELTPAMILLTAYARTVAKWSENKEFLMNLPLFNRDTAEGIENVVADFTNIVLVEMDFTKQKSFIEDAKAIQKNFLENVEHTNVSGVWVMRRLQKEKGSDIKAPVVFSCNLGEPLLSDEFVEEFGSIDYMISQTPQVWIDFQAFDEDEGLTLLWDSIDEIFPNGLLDEMFEHFKNELLNVIGDGINKEIENLSLGEIRRKEAVEESLKYRAFSQTLHGKIFNCAKNNPDKIAIKNVDSGNTVSYEKLMKNALAIACGLTSRKKQDKSGLVAIFMPRGEKQIISALGVLCAGMGYVPIHVGQAKERVRTMISEKNIAYVITEGEYKEIIDDTCATVFDYETLINNRPLEAPVEVKGTDSAYVIFTSGTTGKPKGVEISHESAANTIDSVNELCDVTENDSILNVSSYDFDLSVYDFWGILREGGSLFVLSQDSWRAADRWLEVIKEEKITLWNSVPTLFKMLLIEAEAENEALSSFRWIMLSGDWIDLDIPERVGTLNADSRILAMGGATEASIWSNYIAVKGCVPKDWVSIPYGKPLPKQIYRVVDENGNDCPDYVPGELWIGGVGVAKGYLGDEELTANKFVTDSFGRWYRTGDMGRFWNDDTIEFLGRRDRQVKLRGHRIELGEIENAIDKLDSVEKSYVDIIEGKQSKALVAYVSLKNAANDCINNLKSSIYSKDSENDIQISQVDETIDKIRNANRRYDRYCSYKAKQLLKKIEKNQVLGKYKNLISEWEKIAGLYDEENFCDEQLDIFFKPFEKNIGKLLSGSMTAKDIVTSEDFVEVDQLLKDDEVGKVQEDIIIKRLELVVGDNKNLKVLILDSHSPEFIKRVCDICGYGNCTLALSSEYYVGKLKEDIDVNVSVIKLDISKPVLKLTSGYDVIVANESIHRSENVDNTLNNIGKILKENGRVIFAEPAKMTSLALLTTVFLKREYTDLRADTGNMLLSFDDWKKIIDASPLSIIISYSDEEKLGGFSFFELISKNRHFEVTDDKWIRDGIKNTVPEYMIPKYCVFINEIPVTANGKVDRAKLKSIEIEEEKETKVSEVKYSETERSLKEIWDKLLKVDSELSDNYFVLGGDSLLATVLRNEIKNIFHIDYSLEDIFLKPVLSDMAEKIEELLNDNRSEEKELVIIRNTEPYEPFPLTQIQQSYLIGRSGVFDLSNVSSHCYFEMDTENLDEKRLQTSLNRIIKLHPMMRVVVCADNMNQRVLKETPEYHIRIEDFTHMSQKLTEKGLSEIRDELSYQIFDPYTWPAYDFRYAKLKNNKGRLFISFDNMFFDGWSMFYIFRQWKQIYDNPNAEVSKSDFTFKEYVLSTNANLDSATYKKDMEYWQNKIDSIYPAPELPVNKDGGNGKFRRFSTSVSYQKWEKLKKLIKSNGLTEPVFLMSLYAEVIARYSRHQKFSLNLTRFNRTPFVEDINHVVGDFTTLTILSLDMTEGDSFVERAKNLQKVLWSDLSHSTVSGVEVERMMNQNKETGITMPVVFTSGIGLTEDRTSEDNSYLGKLGYGLSQTPQVWLDMQVYDDATGLVVSLDAVESLFPENMVEEMFECYSNALNQFIEDDAIWEKKQKSIVIPDNQAMVASINDTDKQFEEKTLLDGFIRNAKNNPDSTAIVFEKKSYSYALIYELAQKCACNILKIGIDKDQPVAIYMDKGKNQIVAALGIMMAGGCYLPLNMNHPVSRNKRIMELAKVCIMIVEDSGKCDDYKDDYRVIDINDLDDTVVDLPKVSSDELAYIIYTSGTTGEPKGVAITHAGAMNTITDVNERLGCTEHDSTIALSQMNFDLSVYDVFGMFDVGGKIVIPESKRAIEPSYWYELLEEERVTVWNSVPAYMQMFVEYLQNEDAKCSSLRSILLSGDWIPVDIKMNVNACITNATVYGLGGATEASIWSNWHEITDIDKDRASIPYGIPLANQKMFILNDNMEIVPNNVPGDLYIAGAGLARCYWNDTERTRASFIENAFDGLRLYNTGDLAMYSPEGHIVFLGREDGQIKLGGYRIEIGEIESAIRKLTNCNNAVVFSGNQLTAYVSRNDNDINVLEGLKDLIPGYMIPKAVYDIDDMPLSANGKVDRKKLIKMFDNMDTGAKCELPRSEVEINLAGIWQECLGIEQIYLADNFFLKGGDSLKAVTIVNEIKNSFHVELNLGTIFEHPTVEALAGVIEEQICDAEEGEI